MSQYQYKYQTELATLYLIATDEKLSGIYWKKQKAPLVEKPNRVIARAIRQISEYLNGKRKTFDIPLEFKGTPFQEKVWKTLQGIPFGETLSYAEIARRINNPKAVRAVGSANGRNPISIIVPCHRVIASDGTLGGYAGGLAVKTQLLTLERQRF